MPKISEVTKRAQATRAIEGLSKRYKPKEKLQLGGKTYLVRDLAALFQKHLDVLSEMGSLRASLAQAVADERRVAQEIQALRGDLFSFLRVQFGRNSAVLGDFGFALPKKPGPKTVAAKVLGAERLRATRKARHTMGKRQRSKIKGVV